MGEIRVRVRLTNAADEALARRGQLAADQVHWLETDALINTGAVRSVIPASLLVPLGVAIRGQRTAEYADGRTEQVGVTEPLIFELLGAIRPRKRSSSATKC